MEIALTHIIAALRSGEPVDAARLDRILRDRNRELGDPARHVAKRRLLPHYRELKVSNPELVASWALTADEEAALTRLLRAKPRRSASGVATVTVITRPHTCSSDCLYCPSDIRMPKSYLANEPACQRAERAYFDPFLQVSSRVATLEAMGHPTDKIELIILGGTWGDYPGSYQTWFVAECFRALNGLEAPYAEPMGQDEEARRAFYESRGLKLDPDGLATEVEPLQRELDAHRITYNVAHARRYGCEPWTGVARLQVATPSDLAVQHAANETAARRVVGLVIETRPDLITPESAREMRALGATKVQMGIQSLDPGVLAANGRAAGPDVVARAFSTLRLFGFKTHVHFMANLLGATPDGDIADYARLVTDPRFLPDEVKLYPCALIGSSRLETAWERGLWKPYDRETLVSVLVADTLATPRYARISRMVRDFSSTDILAGNKSPNLRQLVEERVDVLGVPVGEIRHREIAGHTPERSALALRETRYDTASTREVFLEWVTPEDRIAGFCRLSLPVAPSPVGEGAAMIREVHVYGAVAPLNQAGEGAQHSGLGRALVARACDIARGEGYGRVYVISAVGTRGYYRMLGFTDAGLYQVMDLDDKG